MDIQRGKLWTQNASNSLVKQQVETRDKNVASS